MTRSKQQVTVALAVEANRWIREEALARGWRLAHLWYSGLPAGLMPQGAIVSYLPGNEFVQTVLREGGSVVRLGRLPHPDDALIPAVLPDYPAEGRLAAEHFAERGFKDVGYFGSDPWSDGETLYHGFKERAEATGMTCHLARFKARASEPGEVKEKRKRSEFVEWLRRIPKPLGLLTHGGWRAVTHCGLVSHAGFEIPDDVAVLSSAGRADICESSMPTISLIDADDERRIRTACDLLDRMMAGEKAPREPIMIPPKGMVVRESTDVLAVADSEVKAAVRYMWENLDRDLSVEAIADDVDISSRQLARRFKNSLKRTVTEELRRKRLEKAKEILRTTGVPIAAIAPVVGFHSTAYFHRVFKQAFRMTPAEYRRSQP